MERRDLEMSFEGCFHCGGYHYFRLGRSSQIHQCARSFVYWSFPHFSPRDGSQISLRQTTSSSVCLYPELFSIIGYSHFFTQLYSGMCLTWTNQCRSLSCIVHLMPFIHYLSLSELTYGRSCVWMLHAPESYINMYVYMCMCMCMSVYVCACVIRAKLCLSGSSVSQSTLALHGSIITFWIRWTWDQNFDLLFLSFFLNIQYWAAILKQLGCYF